MVRALAIGTVMALAAFLLDLAVVQLVLGPVPFRPALDGALFPVALGLVVAVLAARPVSRLAAMQWLVDRGLPTTEELVRASRRWLRSTMLVRAAGFVIATEALGAVGYLVNTTTLPPGSPRREALLDALGTGNGWTIAIAGYAIGAVVGGLVVRPGTSTRSRRRVTDLRERDPDAYLQSFSRHAPRVTAAAAAGLGGLLLVLDGPSTRAALETTRVAPEAVVVVALAVLVVHEALLRWLVRRPQHAPSRDLLALDDATRAATVQAVAGSAVGMLGILLSDLLGAVAVDVTGLGWTLLPVFALEIIAIGVWLGHGLGLPHVVTRGDGQQTEPSRAQTR